MTLRRAKGLLFACLMISSLFSGHFVHATTFPDLPGTIEDYMRTSHAVVVGRIGKVDKIHTFYGYQESAAEIERQDAMTPLSLGLPMVDYEVVIEEVLKADALFLSRLWSPTILRVVQDHSPLGADRAYRENTGRFLMFLARNPDNQTYGFYTFAHKIKLDGEGKPHYTFNGEDFPILLDTATDTALINAVKAHK